MARRARRWHWIPALFVAGFALVVAANGALIWFATASFSGLDREHAYETGLNYNAALQGAAAVEALQWRADLAVENKNDGPALVLRLEDRNGRALGGLAIRASLTRPTLASLDRDVQFEEVAPGTYRSAALAGLAPGQWEARLATTGIEPPWQMTQRLVIK